MVNQFLKNDVYKFWSNKNVLITGHNGFKGSWLTLWLLTMGVNVWGYSLSPVKSRSLYQDLFRNIDYKKYIYGNLNDFIGDINDIDTMNKYVKESNPDIVFHLAAQPLVRESYRNPINTWKTNVIGTLNLLECLKNTSKNCSAVFISTDKVYVNNEWVYGYRETDQLGGNDPYSASKAAMEIAIESWKKSFSGHSNFQTDKLLISTARAGNVIGGGDWSQDRLVPDFVKAIDVGEKVIIRNPNSKRPWQFILEPLWGYLSLAKKTYEKNQVSSATAKFRDSYNFGPKIEANRSVEELVKLLIFYWKGNYEILENSNQYYESKLLHLVSDKAKEYLNWEQKMNFDNTVNKTTIWYKDYLDGIPAIECCLRDISFYEKLIYEN